MRAGVFSLAAKDPAETEPDEIFFKKLGADTKIGKKLELVGGLPLWVKQAVPVSSKVSRESCNSNIASKFYDNLSVNSDM